METSMQILSWTLGVVSIFGAVTVAFLALASLIQVIDEIKSRHK